MLNMLSADKNVEPDLTRQSFKSDELNAKNPDMLTCEVDESNSIDCEEVLVNMQTSLSQL